MKNSEHKKVLASSLFIMFLFTGFLSARAYGSGTSLNIQPRSPMFEKTKCRTCHFLDSGGRIVRGELTAPVPILCGECHDKISAEGYMHPTNVRPASVRVPADMPLSDNGELTCCTCHDVHSSYLTPYGTETYLLRRGEIKENFCVICHPDRRSLRAGHMGNLGRAHFTAKYMVSDASQEIDPMSRDCISCHDGSFATSVTIKVGTWTRGRGLKRNEMGSHPIGVDYEIARIGHGRNSDLKPIETVDRRIRFFSGKVGCGSCHNPYSKIEKHLVMSDRRSSLCLSCHALGRAI